MTSPLCEMCCLERIMMVVGLIILVWTFCFDGYVAVNFWFQLILQFNY